MSGMSGEKLAVVSVLTFVALVAVAGVLLAVVASNAA